LPPFQINLKNRESNFLKKDSGILIVRTENKYKSWGKRRDLITVIFPIRDKPLDLQQFNICSIVSNLWGKLISYSEFRFKENVIPRDLKVLLFHFKPSSSYGF
jgi:hypothetical protein